MEDVNMEAAESTTGEAGCLTTEGDSLRARGEVTLLLAECRKGDQAAFQSLVSLVYHDLRRIAHRQLVRARPGATLDTTGLVHEAYLRLVDQPKLRCRDRAHFYATAARAMRFVIVDQVRQRCAAKRGGGMPLCALAEDQAVEHRRPELVLAIDAALDRLACLDQRLIRIVECRFFAGFTEEETAAALDVSTRTVQRDWKRAKAWLREELDPAPAPASRARRSPLPESESLASLGPCRIAG
jgi:RNA polymerase sigma factor (TIGR02999 family)